MLIILEGASGVGKSSVAEQLTDTIRSRWPRDTVEVWRPGVPYGHPLDTYVTPLLGYRPQAPRPDADGSLSPAHHIICEGWHWAEAVYSQLFGRHTHLNTALLRYVELFLASRGAHLVHLIRDATDITQDMRSRESDYLSETDVSRMITGYMAVARLSALPAQECHVEDTHLVDSILAAARGHEVRASVLNPLTTYIGMPQVHTLVLGNTRGHGVRDARTPCFMPYPSTCGEFLMRGLAGLPHVRQIGTVGLANACDTDALSEILRIVSPRRILTLGDAARHALNILVPDVARCDAHVTVSHPQYARRDITASNAAMLYGQSIGWILKHGV